MVEQQKRIEVYFRGKLVGEFFADIVVEDKIILELKAVENLHPSHNAQLLNYLKASEYEVGYVINFGKIPLQFERVPDTRNGDLLPEFKPEKNLTDNEVEIELNLLIAALEKKRIFYELPATVPRRSDYRLLAEELEREQMVYVSPGSIYGHSTVKCNGQAKS